jgi:hypothetical protein
MGLYWYAGQINLEITVFRRLLGTMHCLLTIRIHAQLALILFFFKIKQAERRAAANGVQGVVGLLQYAEKCGVHAGHMFGCIWHQCSA